MFLSALIASALCAIQGHSNGGGFDDVFRVDGLSNLDRIGHQCSALSDLDGDGFEDFVFGGRVGLGHSVHVHSGLTGDEIWSRQWSVSDKEILSLTRLGDLNGDGDADLLVCASTPTRTADEFFVLSGADGSTLAREDAPSGTGFSTYYEGFGQAAAGVSDLNGDGVTDFLIGAPDAWVIAFGPRPGRVFVYSGADFQLIATWEGDHSEQGFGSSFAEMQDLNNDGVNEVLVGSPHTSKMGVVSVLSGTDGSVLFKTLSLGTTEDGFGLRLLNVGDRTGDGAEDFLVGAPFETTGRVRLLNGRTADFESTWWGDDGFEKFGFGLAEVGDQTGDGVSDFAVLADGTAFLSGRIETEVRLLDGATGEAITQWEIPIQAGLGVGANGSLARLRDLSGQSGGDRLVFASANMGDFGGIQVYAHSRFMEASATELSAGIGADVSLTIKFPDSTAGSEYRVLFSQSGVAGFEYGVPIPLTYDSMVAKSFQGAYFWLKSFGLCGTLDTSGDAQALVRSAPGAWSHLIGRNFYASSVALDAVGIPTHASEAIQFTVVP